MKKQRWHAAILAVIVLLVPALETLTEARGPRGPRGGPGGGGARASHHRHHSPHRRPHHHGHAHVHVRVWRPVRWWHPIGFTLTVLATTAIVVSVTEDSNGGDGKDEEGKQDNQAQELDGAKYYYDRGTFYKKEGDVYVVIKAPIKTPKAYTAEEAEAKRRSTIHEMMNDSGFG